MIIPFPGFNQTDQCVRQVYNEVPMWWYLAIFFSSFAMAMATMYTGHSGLPWWGLIVGIIISAAFLPFVLTVYAITGMSTLSPNVDGVLVPSVGFSPNIQSLVQMLGAAMIPGNPQANMYFTLYGYNTLDQARGLIRDLKMGQYTKLPPRVTFTVQCLGSVVVRSQISNFSSFVNLTPQFAGRSSQLCHHEIHHIIPPRDPTRRPRFQCRTYRFRSTSYWTMDC